MGPETDRWTYVPARDIGPVRSGPVELIVVHTAEMKESPVSAENLARYAQNPGPKKKSWHLAIDSDSIVQCVLDSRVAYAAPGANHNGLQLELACFAGQTVSQWRDPYSIALIALAADAAAQYCLKFELPPVHLTDWQLSRGQRGIIGHDQASRVWRLSDHMDPGPTFPWPRFMRIVEAMIAERESRGVLA